MTEMAGGMRATPRAAVGTVGARAWAFHPELRIMFVNSFELIGEKTR
jgi:hypothetical protein